MTVLPPTLFLMGNRYFIYFIIVGRSQKHFSFPFYKEKPWLMQVISHAYHSTTREDQGNQILWLSQSGTHVHTNDGMGAQKFYQKEYRQEFYSSNIMTNNYFELYSLYSKYKGVIWSVNLGILTKKSRHGGYQIPKWVRDNLTQNYH